MSSFCIALYPSSDIFENLGWLTANIPAAVTILLLSLLVKAEIVLDAKLGSLRVRPLPVICLGGIVAEAGETLRNPSVSNISGICLRRAYKGVCDRRSGLLRGCYRCALDIGDDVFWLRRVERHRLLM